jgi:hypothetical protein
MARQFVAGRALHAASGEDVATGEHARATLGALMPFGAVHPITVIPP